MGFFPMSGASYWTISTPSGEAIGRMTTSGSASYYIKDHLGSVRVVVNSSGTVLETRDYYPFTPLRSVSRPSALCGLEMPGRSYLSGTKAKENFTGHERDAESGMLYAGARYYMPNIGRWTSVDPLAASYAAWSPYNYVLNNPLGFVDPDGRAPVIVDPPNALKIGVSFTGIAGHSGVKLGGAIVVRNDGRVQAVTNFGVGGSYKFTRGMAGGATLDIALVTAPENGESTSLFATFAGGKGAFGQVTGSWDSDDIDDMGSVPTVNQVADLLANTDVEGGGGVGGGGGVLVGLQVVKAWDLRAPQRSAVNLSTGDQQGLAPTSSTHTVQRHADLWKANERQR